MALEHQKVQSLISAQQEYAKLRGKNFAVKKPKRQVYPLNVERKYLKELLPLISVLDRIRKQMMPKLEAVLAKANFLRPTSDSSTLNEDAFSDDLKFIIDAGLNKFLIEYSDEVLKVIALKIARSVNLFNETQFDKTIMESLGVNPFASEPWLAQEMEAFVADNVALIKTIPSQFFGSIQGIVSDGARSGKNMQDITADLQKITGVAKRRAKFIARDQVSKFNGDLNQLRQKNVGINSYIWSTSLDERVRPSHAAKEGKKFSWDNPPNDTGHPGEDYNCRCVAIPVFQS
jgi:SPP1 gp7 family putative phage head morphogenesis protein